MASKGLCILMAAVVVSTLLGCGGGSKSIDPTRATVRKRILAATRLATEAFAVAGLIRHVTRAATPPNHTLLTPRLISVLLPQKRDASQGIDAATGLYYKQFFSGDGSGHQDLFTDSGYHTPAGNFTWLPPVWVNKVANTYPALLHVTFQITAGNFAWDHGTMDVTANDGTGNNDRIDMTLVNAQGEKFVGSFNVVNGVITAAAKDTLADGTTCDVNDYTDTAGDIISTATFPDDSQATVTTTPDGNGSDTYTDPGGTTDASGNFDSDGTDTVTYDDGSEETVDVDTSSE